MPIVIGLGMLMAGAMSAAGSINAANAAAKAAEYNANNADQEANQLDRNATLLQAQTDDDVKQFRIIARKQMGTNRASIGASGLQMDGNALDVMAESAANVEHDAAAIRMQGNEKLNSVMLQAQQRRTYAQMLRAGADDTRMGGYLSAGGSVLGSIGQAYAAGGGAKQQTGGSLTTRPIARGADYTGRSNNVFG